MRHPVLPYAPVYSEHCYHAPVALFTIKNLKTSVPAYIHASAAAWCSAQELRLSEQKDREAQNLVVRKAQDQGRDHARFCVTGVWKSIMVSGTITKPRLRELRLGLEQPTAPLADMWASEA